MPGERRSGWRPLTDLVARGLPELADPLATALAETGRVDELTHGFHAYPAGLHAHAARQLLALLPGDTLYDPFCGGGTSLVEGLVAGRQVFGRDLSPVAVLVARARTRLPDADQLTAFRSAGRRIADAAKASQVLPEGPEREVIERWYDEQTARELEGLARGIGEVEGPARSLLWACFSSILVKVSQRESETSRRNVGGTRPRGSTAVLFHKKVRELGRRLVALGEAVPDGARAWVQRGDARAPVGRTVAAALTSPPYPGVFDYLPLQELRRAWLGFDDDAALRRELGSRRGFRADRRRAVSQWRDDTRAWMGAVAEALQPGGRLAVVIGDGLVGDRVIDTLQTSVAAGEAVGLRVLASASGGRHDPGRDAVRHEHILLLERP